MNEKQRELIRLIEIADHFRGLNASIAKRKILTWEYLRLVRNGRSIKDKPLNHEKVDKLIALYKEEIEKRKVWITS